MKSNQFYNLTAWKWFSRYVLLYHSKVVSKNLCMAQCSTSGQWIDITDKEMQCGHFIKVFEGGGSTNFSVAFEFKNVLPQRAYDNRKMSGRQDVMSESLKSKFGNDVIDYLMFKKKGTCKLDKIYLQEITDKYKMKFKKLCEERNIIDPWK